jgi:hypothetical protein
MFLADYLGKVTVIDAGKRAGVSTDMAATMKALERENRELGHPQKPSRYRRVRDSLALS